MIRDGLIRVDREALDRALQQWNAAQAQTDDRLAIDGETMRNAIDAQGHPTHILSVVGPHTKIGYPPKK